MSALFAAYDFARATVAGVVDVDSPERGFVRLQGIINMVVPLFNSYLGVKGLQQSLAVDVPRLKLNARCEEHPHHMQVQTKLQVSGRVIGGIRYLTPAVTYLVLCRDCGKHLSTYMSIDDIEMSKMSKV